MIIMHKMEITSAKNIVNHHLKDCFNLCLKLYIFLLCVVRVWLTEGN
jgi:hypothetical protein